MKGTCAILDREIITSPRSLPDSTVVYQLGLPKIREIKYEVFLLIVAFFMLFFSHLRPRRISFFIFFIALFAAIKQLQNAPTHTFLCNCAPSPCPSHGRHWFWLVVVSTGLIVATYGHDRIPLSLIFFQLKFDDLTDDTASLLHVPPQPRVLPDSPSIVHANF